MKLRTKLLSLSAALAAVATAVAAPAFGDQSQQNFILIAGHGIGSTAVTITEYDTNGNPISGRVASHTFGTGGLYWLIDTPSNPGSTAGVGYITLVGGKHSWKVTSLPSCFRISEDDSLHPVPPTQEPCNTDHASQGSWTG